MDKYRRKWEASVDVDLSRLEVLVEEKKYHLLGLVREVREIQTKKGSRMAFVRFEDYNGSIELVVFPEQWESSRESIAVDAVLNQRRGDVRCFYVCIGQKMSTVSRGSPMIRWTLGTASMVNITTAPTRGPRSR